MNLLVNSQQEIISYASLGSITNAIEFSGNIPDDFEDNFKPSFYLLQDNLIVKNPNYVEPKVETPDFGPTDQDQMIAEITTQVAHLTEDKTDLQTQVDLLSQANAQQTILIAQLKQQLMTTDNEGGTVNA